MEFKITSWNRDFSLGFPFPQSLFLPKYFHRLSPKKNRTKSGISVMWALTSLSHLCRNSSLALLSRHFSAVNQKRVVALSFSLKLSPLLPVSSYREYKKSILFSVFTWKQKERNYIERLTKTEFFQINKSCWNKNSWIFNTKSWKSLSLLWHKISVKNACKIKCYCRAQTKHVFSVRHISCIIYLDQQTWKF